MGITRDYSRYSKALLSPYQGAITIRGIDLSLGLDLGLKVKFRFRV